LPQEKNGVYEQSKEKNLQETKTKTLQNVVIIYAQTILNGIGWKACRRL
jgi:hypothetical protein